MDLYELAERLNPQPPIVNDNKPLTKEDMALLAKLMQKLSQPNG